MEQFESGIVKEKEHLNPGVRAIMASLGDGTAKGKPEFGGLPEALSDNDDIEFVDIDTDPKEGLEEGFSGEYVEPHWAYVMSPVDGAHKFSVRYADCTGIATVGIDKETQGNISFLTHQNPNYFTQKKREDFLRDLRARLEEMKTRCEPGTVDAVLFGGRFANVKEVAHMPDHPVHTIDKDLYVESIRIAGEEIERVLGFSPTVISGPKLHPAWEQVIFDTNERRLFLERIGKGDLDFVRNFEARDVVDVTQKLTPGQWPLSKEVKEEIRRRAKERMERGEGE